MVSGVVGAIAAVSLCGLASGASSAVRIAALRDGEVWTVRPGGGWDHPQTRSSGRIEDFRFSPRGEFLAYARRIRAADERPICSIVILDASTGKVLKEIEPEDGWIDIDKWLGTRLRYHASSHMEVSAFFEFDTAQRRARELDPTAGSRGFDTDLSPDGSLLAYVDDAGVGRTFQERLHLVQVTSGTDRIAVSKRSIMAPAIAWSNDAVAFVEVVDDTTASRDRVWVYRLPEASVKLLADRPASSKNAGSGLLWSPDDRRLSIDFGSRVTVLNVSDALALRTFQGTNACWLDPTTLIVESQGGVDRVDVVTGNRRVLVRGASHPQCLPIRH